MNRVKVGFALLCVIIICSIAFQGLYQPEAEEPIGAGIALSFDDSDVESWFAARELFLEYNARATFFVTRFDRLSVKQVEMLRVLEGDGHEIGAHGHRHRKAPDYVAAHGIEAYLRDEIEPALEAMRDKGFEPTSFAYPYGLHTRELDLALEDHFSILRGFILRTSVAGLPEEAFVMNGGERFIAGVSMDDKYGNYPYIRPAMDKAEEQKCVLVLVGHTILTGKAGEDVEKLSLSIGQLETILQQAQASGLDHFTISELS